MDYGEWCEPDVESTMAMRVPQVKVATAYFAQSGKQLAEIAVVLGKDEDIADYRRMVEQAKKHFGIL